LHKVLSGFQRLLVGTVDKMITNFCLDDLIYF
jgi:hypothetical protein